MAVVASLWDIVALCSQLANGHIAILSAACFIFSFFALGRRSENLKRERKRKKIFVLVDCRVCISLSKYWCVPKDTKRITTDNGFLACAFVFGMTHLQQQQQQQQQQEEEEEEEEEENSNE